MLVAEPPEDAVQSEKALSAAELQQLIVNIRGGSTVLMANTTQPTGELARAVCKTTNGQHRSPNIRRRQLQAIKDEAHRLRSGVGEDSA